MLEHERAMNSPSMPVMIEATSAPGLVRWWRGAGRRVKAPLLHALASLVVAITVSVIIFVLWFPGALATVAGGLTLFLILTTVDVISGPMLTAIVADPTKAARSFSSSPSGTASTSCRWRDRSCWSSKLTACAC